MKYEEIVADLKAGKYAPIYFLSGEESYFLDDIATRIEKNALTEDEKAFNQTILYGNDVSMTLSLIHILVLPYIQADPVLCKHLENTGAATVMPLGAPIGTNKGLVTRDLLEIIIEQSNVPVIVDAGIGAPSHAAAAMEMGAAAVLVNTAIAVSPNPVEMGRAFKLAVEAGRMAFEAKLAKQYRHAQASSPLTAFLD